MNRRLFLQTLSLAGVSLALPPFARAQASSKPYFVLIRMAGGWDVTLGLDPKVHGADDDQEDMFIEYQASEILSAGSLRFGPAMAPMLPYASSMSVVNGLITATTDNGHTANLDYMSSGNGSGKAPYLPAELAVSSTSGSLGVVFQGQTSLLDRNTIGTSTQNVEALKSSLSLGDFSGLIAQSGLKDSFYQAQQAMLQDASKIDLLNQKLAESKYEQESDQTKRAGKILAATFASGTAFQGQIDLSSGSLDTHSSHEKTHLQEQTKGWTSVAAIFDAFKAVQMGTETLYDQTLFMVVSEFSRTPALNGAKGKDHNPLTNSALFAGGRVRGGVSFGSSHLITRKRAKSGMPSHTALPVDIKTGRVAANRKEMESGGFQYLTPETLVATVAQIQGVDWSKFRSVASTTPYIASLMK